ncbi:hypothetical protein BN7_2914 [Wickerhamomyces ciferrii]|uniref:Impact N-terminal domain-containing protein n=1 Tax=Wickerhamomyces ciferrii (strain ATCC 14091 / BCRC 22168 / CBS 111 / JCM 3599 / NBRC 0793 / NRRL Y-1031 F-60-10) TaxID=1206466 RepID=K0KK98_WICCF|nr:uncharacterized protein BN7_2914 [Wickerhamomyces ciferrii]CCH43366.1 hypothetical protein BN7_2914 [Wickerhamomyces ciferrii]
MVNWNESEVLIDKKSKFQGRATVLKSAQDVETLLEDLVNNDKSIQKATHKHMYAWRVGSEQKGKIIATNQGMSDCGESGAGIRIMTLLERSKLVNVLVIVSRWYGGTALGPARFRHITTTAVESLRKGGFLKDGENGDDNGDGEGSKHEKKKSKKKRK